MCRLAFFRALSATLTTIIVAGALTACSAPPPAAGPARETADAIYAGGPIITVDDAQPSAEAVAVKGGRILLVGARADVEALRGPSTVVHDLAGHTMLPGFVDAHGHVSTVGLQAVSANLLPPPDGANASIALLEQSVRAWMKTSPVANTYGIVIGFGYDDSQLREQRHPTRDDLDRISADLPVYYIHQSGHLGVANSRALELSGITPASPDPPGGVIQRRAGSTVPNGVFEENAHFMVLMQLVFAKLGPEQLRGMLMAGQDLYTKYGFTTAQDGATDAVSLQGFMAAAADGQLKIDVVAYPGSLTLGDGAVMDSPYHSRSYTGRFRIGGIKIILDGSPQGKTAWLTKPYFQAAGRATADVRRLRGPARYRGPGARRTGVREELAGDGTRQRRRRHRPVPRCGRGRGQQAPERRSAAGGHPWPDHPARPGGPHEGARRDPFFLSHAHVLLGRLAP